MGMGASESEMVPLRDLNTSLDLVFQAALSSKITLQAAFSGMSAFLTKYRDRHYFIEVAQSSIIKWIYFILIYLKCA